VNRHNAPRPFRLTILASHPVQYHVPLFRALATHPGFEVMVVYCGAWGAKRYFDAGFRQAITWDVNLLEGYDQRFLRNLSWRQGPSTFFGTISPEVTGFIRRNRPDALLVHGWSKATNWLAMRAAWGARVPVWMRGESTLLSEHGSMKLLLKRSLLRRLFRRVHLFLAIGQRNQEFYEAYGVPRDRVVLVPYAADNGFFMERAQRESEARHRTRRAFGLREDVPLVLVSGKLLAQKRPQDVLEACAVVARRAAVGLAYVGDGIERAALERRAHDLGFSGAVFLGVQNQSALPALYSAADLLVLASDFEPWGMVVNEAMCCGLPVVVSDKVGAGADLVADGINGLVYPAGDVSALADRMLRLVQDEGLRHSMARESVKRICEWSVEVGVEALAGQVARMSADRAVAG
jgi:glycosyltransferase involved in cell wall biosynthesis